LFFLLGRFRLGSTTEPCDHRRDRRPSLHSKLPATFWSLRNVYRLIGYTSKRNCEYIDSRAAWADLLAKLASQAAAEIEKAGGQVAANCSADCLRVKGATNITFRIARWRPGKRENHSAHWSIERRVHLPAGWIVAIRLGEQNEAVLDYLLFQTPGVAGRLIRFSEKARARRGMERFGNFDALIRSLIRRVTKPNCASPTRPARPNKQSRSSQSKRVIGHARR
jgi:hypothetical protein